MLLFLGLCLPFVSFLFQSVLLTWCVMNYVFSTSLMHWQNTCRFPLKKKIKIIRIENVKDNNEDVNQFEEMLLFNNPTDIKHIEKDFDKNLIPYMRKGSNKNFG
jgi:hypothetical protein